MPAAVVLAALAAAALLAHEWWAIATIAAVALAVCLGARGRRWPYLTAALITPVTIFLVTPFVEVRGLHVLWSGPTIPVLGHLDVTTEELAAGGVQALRLGAVTLAFAAYALRLDHDRLLQAAWFARRSVLAVALATRLLPTLERDAVGLLEALRGRGVKVTGVRGRARLVSPLLAGSLERGLNLAEAMEARGFGRPGATRAPGPRWTALDRLGLAFAPALVAAGVLWL